ncbi:MAG: hypothetical protein AMXMBFR7_03250 [Planctomycetota bacterium]
MTAGPAPGALSPAARTYLLQLARSAAAHALNGTVFAAPEPPAGNDVLTAPGACFVTFKRKGLPPGESLRGCLGTFDFREPLYRSVARLAADSVTADSRFRNDPVTSEELPELEIDISVLHPPRELAGPLAFELGVDGIVVEGRGTYEGRRGVYLPQVAVEFEMDKEAFLNSCCEHKAGLPAGAWRDPKRCAVRAFRAEVFGEEGLISGSKA